MSMGSCRTPRFSQKYEGKNFKDFPSQIEHELDYGQAVFSEFVANDLNCASMLDASNKAVQFFLFL